MPVFAFLAALWACAPVVIDEPGSVVDTSIDYRRVYANDAAANQALLGAIAGEGVKFVIQPHGDYLLRLEGSAQSGNSLNIYRYEGGHKYQTLTGANDNTGEFFVLTSDQGAPAFFVAKLASPAPAGGWDFGHVSLQASGSGNGLDLPINLIFVGRLSALPDAASKAAYQSRFFAAMRTIYGRYGIGIRDTFTVVDGSAPVTVTFPGDGQSLPGRRLPGFVNFYLVESIQNGTGAAAVNGSILGFSPREAIDPYRDPESRIILANYPDVGELAATAAHEMGHFFGLRHPVATRVDLSFDDDTSNRDDGFPDTRFCSLGAEDAPGPAARIAKRAACVRVMSADCPEACDLLNLMHAYAVPNACLKTYADSAQVRVGHPVRAAQDSLSPDQVRMLKANIPLILGD